MLALSLPMQLRSRPWQSPQMEKFHEYVEQHTALNQRIARPFFVRYPSRFDHADISVDTMV